MIANKRAALFDLDGVIIDTEGIYSRFWSAVDEQFPTGVPHFSQVIKGRNLQEILGNHFPAHLQGQVKEMLMNFQADMRYNIFPGALELVRELRQAGLTTCIVTSSDHQKMQALFNQHTSFPDEFDAIVTGDMVSRAKPDPECFLKAAQLAGCDIDRCFVFEDSLNGLKAGMASGAKVIGVTGTYPAEKVQPLCHFMVSGLHELTVEKLMEL